VADDDELRARIEARINARRAQMEQARARDSGTRPHHEDGGQGSQHPAQPSGTSPPADPPLAESPPAESRSAESPPADPPSADSPPPDPPASTGTESTSRGLKPSRPWLTGTAPSVVEANRKAGQDEESGEHSPAGSAAALRPNRAWQRDDPPVEPRSGDAQVQPPAMRKPSAVPIDAAVPDPEPEGRRARRQARRDQKQADKTADDAARDAAKQAAQDEKQARKAAKRGEQVAAESAAQSSVPVPYQQPLTPIRQRTPSAETPAVTAPVPEVVRRPEVSTTPPPAREPAATTSAAPTAPVTPTAPPPAREPAAVPAGRSVAADATAARPRTDPATLGGDEFQQELARLKAQIAELSAELGAVTPPADGAGGLFRRSRRPGDG
jgi:hypothetical protein